MLKLLREQEKAIMPALQDFTSFWDDQVGSSFDAQHTLVLENCQCCGGDRMRPSHGSLRSVYCQAL